MLLQTIRAKSSHRHFATFFIDHCQPRERIAWAGELAATGVNVRQFGVCMPALAPGVDPTKVRVPQSKPETNPLVKAREQVMCE